jgi:hypothetical protein
MTWRSMVMAISEFSEFQRELAREYRQEIAAGKLAGYTLFARKREAGNHFLFIPPGAVVLFERMPRWATRLRPFNGTPDLKDFEPVPMHRDG